MSIVKTIMIINRFMSLNASLLMLLVQLIARSLPLECVTPTLIPYRVRTQKGSSPVFSDMREEG